MHQIIKFFPNIDTVNSTNVEEKTEPDVQDTVTDKTDKLDEPVQSEPSQVSIPVL